MEKIKQIFFLLMCLFFGFSQLWAQAVITIVEGASVTISTAGINNNTFVSEGNSINTTINTSPYDGTVSLIGDLGDFYGLIQVQNSSTLFYNPTISNTTTIFIESLSRFTTTGSLGINPTIEFGGSSSTIRFLSDNALGNSFTLLSSGSSGIFEYGDGILVYNLNFKKDDLRFNNKVSTIKVFNNTTLTIIP
ncbi:MAG: hypothetical protein V1773_13460 [bacterium]